MNLTQHFMDAAVRELAAALPAEWSVTRGVVSSAVNQPVASFTLAGVEVETPANVPLSDTHTYGSVLVLAGASNQVTEKVMWDRFSNASTALQSLGWRLHSAEMGMPESDDNNVDLVIRSEFTIPSSVADDVQPQGDGA